MGTFYRPLYNVFTLYKLIFSLYPSPKPANITQTLQNVYIFK